MIVGSFPVVLGTTTLTVALHDVAVDFGAHIGMSQWVVTGYLAALCLVVPMAAWLQRQLGARRLWCAGLTAFALGSVLCAVSWDPVSLIAARMIQGLGGGVTMPLLTTILMQVAPERDRLRLASVVGLVTGLAPIAGPVLGGVVVGVIGWRWLFWMNLPLGAVGLSLALRLVERDRPQAGGRLDLLGMVMLPPALLGLLWGLSRAPDAGQWGDAEVLAPLTAGGVLLLAFVGWSLHRRERSLVEVRVLGNHATWAATLMLLLASVVLHGGLVLLPLMWQQLQQTSALQAGLLLVPHGMGALASRFAALRLMAARGPRVVSMTGFGLAALGTMPFAVVDPGSADWVLLVVLVVRGLGIGMVIVPLMTVAFDGLEQSQIPHASVVIRISQQLGGALGVTMLVAILTTTSATGSVPPGFHTAFSWMAAVAGGAMALSVVLPGPGRRQPNA
ncbi:DHA2 family efflux MFS transporter permease subunit [Pseudonocardia xishanensis]|uniref:DHA2 family efflux MFS transporter permease subunit n=1 Tax=Pseudonocardia xishanensis TaxID=630995 RepID=UPI0031F0ACFF